MVKGGVWHLVSNRWNSAVTEYALNTARSLAVQGITNTVTPLLDSPCAKRATEAGLPVLTLPSFSLTSLPDLRRYYRAVEPEVVVTYGGNETFLAKAFPAARVVRVRGQDQDATRRFSSLGLRVSHSHVEALVTPNRLLKERFSAVFPRTVRTITLGCDSEKFCFVDAPRSRVPEVLVVGRLDPIKGHAKLFRIFKVLLGSWPASQPRPLLRIIGEPANLTVADLHGFAASAALRRGDDYEIIPSRVAAIAEAMNAASLGVVASLGSEMICRVAEEFLLCGTPVFVSGVGALEEVLFPQAGGSYLGCSEEVAARRMQALLLQGFLESPLERQERAEQARDYFSFEVMAKGWRSLLNL